MSVLHSPHLSPASIFSLNQLQHVNTGNDTHANICNIFARPPLSLLCFREDTEQLKSVEQKHPALCVLIMSNLWAFHIYLAWTHSQLSDTQNTLSLNYSCRKFPSVFSWALHTDTVLLLPHTVNAFNITSWSFSLPAEHHLFRVSLNQSPPYRLRPAHARNAWHSALFPP